VDVIDKRVLVVGLGKSGVASALFLKARGARVTVSDAKPQDQLKDEIPVLLDQGIAVETGVVMVVYLHESLDKRIALDRPLTEVDIHEAAIEGAVHRLRPKLMTVCAVLASLIPILWASGIGSDVMKPIAAPMVGGMITSTIHVLILVPVFFVLMKERALRRGSLRPEPAE